MADEPLTWTEDGPRSQAFGDIYYSLEDGLAESRAVFLAGCGLPEAWADRRRFTIGELGFGTGLNIAALLHLWRRTRPPGARLSIFSIEGFPVPRDDAARALAAWPEIAEEADALLSRWPGVRRGFHHLDLPEFDATLDLAVMDVADALDRWSGQADAWFLDGFSPALNPAMWSEDILAKVAARSAPGSIAATFTVAGSVRRGLQAAGFEVAKRPGHGRKRERLEARLPGQLLDPAVPSVAIIGGGIAAASLARAFRVQGVEPLVLIGEAPAASGNPAALVTPGLDAGDTVRARFYAETYARALQLYAAHPEAIIATGADKLETGPKDAGRFDTIAAQDIFEPGAVARTPNGLDFTGGLVVDPGRLLPVWLGDAEVGEVTSLVREGASWRIDLADGQTRRADVVVVAAGWGTAALCPTLALSPVRGQASWAESVAQSRPVAFGAYAIPTIDGVLFGATHDRGDTSTDTRLEDHQRNLIALAKGLPDLAKTLADAPLNGRAATRAATPDRLPAAGEIAPGLYVLGGLGSRGFTTAPLLAEHIVAQVLSLPSPMANDLAERVSPHRPNFQRAETQTAGPEIRAGGLG